jgi:hypothetical protein
MAATGLHLNDVGAHIRKYAEVSGCGEVALIDSVSAVADWRMSWNVLALTWGSNADVLRFQGATGSGLARASSDCLAGDPSLPVSSFS